MDRSGCPPPPPGQRHPPSSLTTVDLRCTAKLAKRLELGKLEKTPSNHELLANWHASLIYADRQPLVLAVEDRTRLALVVRARDLDNLPKHLSRALYEILVSIDVDESTADGYASRMAGGLRYSASIDRSVLASINEFAHHVRLRYLSGEILSECMEWLAQMPMKPLDYDRPRKVVPAAIRFDPLAN